MPRFEIEWSSEGLEPGAQTRLKAAFERAAAVALFAEGLDPARVRTGTVPTILERLADFRGPKGERHMTRTGRIVNRFAPAPEDWDLDALIWSQSNLCRYGGEMFVRAGADGRIHEHAFYSTAEHQLNAMKAVDILHGDLPRRERARLKLYAGVHDMVETRMSDLISVIKKMIPDAKAYENELEKSFFASLGLAPEIPPEVDAIDKRLVMNEGPAVFPGTDLAFWRERTQGREPIPGIVVPDERFVVRVRLPANPNRRELADEIRLWSFQPLVASALLDEIRTVRAELARAAA